MQFIGSDVPVIRVDEMIYVNILLFCKFQFGYINTLFCQDE